MWVYSTQKRKNKNKNKRNDSSKWAVKYEKESAKRAEKWECCLKQNSFHQNCLFTPKMKISLNNWSYDFLLFLFQLPYLMHIPILFWKIENHSRVYHAVTFTTHKSFCIFSYSSELFFGEKNDDSCDLIENNLNKHKTKSSKFVVRPALYEPKSLIIQKWIELIQLMRT